MVEYIEREAAILALYEEDAITMRGAKLLREFPVADVRPVVHGRWVYLGKYSDGYNWRCSVCKRESVMALNYCPYCGAKMEGWEEQ